MTKKMCRTNGKRVRKSRARVFVGMLFELAVTALIIWAVIAGGKAIFSAIAHPTPETLSDFAQAGYSLDIDKCEAAQIKPLAYQTSVYDRFSKEDVKLFAALLEAEGGCAPTITKERIGIAFLNRITSELYRYNTVPELVYEEGQYETAMNNLLPENPTDENLELAYQIMEAFVSDNWKEFCESRNLSTKVVFQANSNIDQSGYSYTTLDEYGKVGSFSYHMVYGESKYDYSDVPYSEDYVGDYI